MSVKTAHILLLVAVSIVCGTCRESGIGPSPASIELTVVDVGATEVWLRMKTTEFISGSTYTLKLDGRLVFSIQGSPVDTVVFYDSLIPEQIYTFHANSSMNNVQTDSIQLTITTIDSTSHNFMWQTFVLGGGDDSGLRDVTVIGDNDIWAAGFVSVRDSSGQIDPNAYNAVKWNGSRCQLLTIPTAMYGGFVDTSELSSIFAFSENDVWTFSVAGSYSHWNGNSWQTNYLAERSGGGIKFWGLNFSDLYLVGTNGSISRYSDGAWRKIESGTTSTINDIWGVVNPVTHKKEVYCAVSDIFQVKDRKILKLVDGAIDSVAWENNSDVVITLWAHQGFPLYVGGRLGLYEYRTGKWRKIDFSGFNIYPSNVRGTGLNNIVVVGLFGVIAHFNGVDWKILTDVYDANYTAVAIKGNTVAAVGFKSGKAILTIGKQN